MQVAQRGTSATSVRSSDGYHTLDRFQQAGTGWYEIYCYHTGTI